MSTIETHTSRTNPNLANNLGEKIKKIALVGSLAVGSAAAVAGYEAAQPTTHVQGYDVMYTAKPYDTEWGIAHKEFPNLDPRQVVGYINSQLPKGEQATGTVTPGEEFHFGSDAQVGDHIADAATYSSGNPKG